MSADLRLPNIIRLVRVMFLKIAPRQSWRVYLVQRHKLRYSRCLVWKTKSC